MNNYGYIRVAAVVPTINVAQCDANAQHIIKHISKLALQGVNLAVFPELAVTGYTCGDLFAQKTLINGAEKAVSLIAKATAGKNITVAIGAPHEHNGRLFNCAVVAADGKIIGVVPKTYLPNYREFYEKRWFTSALVLPKGCTTTICGQEVPFGTDIFFVAGEMKLACEICEDLWTAVSPGSFAALNGANVVVNLSATNELIGKHDRLLSLIEHQSYSGISAYIYASSGFGESTTDVVFAGNAIIAEAGNIIRSGERFSINEQVQIADIDLEKLNVDRRTNGTFADNYRQFPFNYREIQLPTYQESWAQPNPGSMMSIERNPFVPANNERLNSRCEEVVNIQTEGLMRRLHFTGIKKVVIGVSGGLDSTLALLVAEQAFTRLGLDKKNIVGITMPGFGTSDRTHNNASKLMDLLGITSLEIPIANAVRQHFTDIGHDETIHDVTYENSQARERTQILMDYANRINALVVGTGDLSELALGWATYNGDHMSMYGVNAGVAKTLVRHLVKWVALTIAPDAWGEECKQILLDVVDTPISPELTPADDSGNIKQKTEDLVGPYELHDFFIFHMLRYGFSPSKIFFLAKAAFNGDYTNEEIKHWLTVFCRRFFNQQFKRSCMPDGPKVCSISLSPRGDWRMPSDASSALWLQECNSLSTD